MRATTPGCQTVRWPGGGEGGGDLPHAGLPGGELGPVQLGDQRQRSFLFHPGHQLAPLGLVCEGRGVISGGSCGGFWRNVTLTMRSPLHELLQRMPSAD